MNSSSENTVSPLRVLIMTGTISSLNLPAFLAASALFWEATAKRSCCSRVVCHWRARAKARAAQLVHAPGRRIDGNAGVDGSLARRVLAGAGRQDLAQDDF